MLQRWLGGVAEVNDRGLGRAPDDKDQLPGLVISADLGTAIGQAEHTKIGQIHKIGRGHGGYVFPLILSGVEKGLVGSHTSDVCRGLRLDV